MDGSGRFNYGRERLKGLFVWGPLGVLMFGFGGYFVLDDKWGITHSGVVSGGATGAAVGFLLAAIVAWRWHHRYTADEVREGRGIMADSARTAPGWKVWTGTGCTTAACAAGTAIFGSAFFMSFVFVLMTFTSVIAWVTALGRRGVFQPIPEDSSEGSTGRPAARQA